jgi:hypothetical protein
MGRLICSAGIAGGLLAVPVLAGSRAAVPARVDVDRQAAVGRVRATDAEAAVLLGEGRARSATFRALVDAIQQSDLIVYIDTRPLKLPAQLRLVAVTPGCRHVQVSVRIPGLPTNLIAWLGHELQHAVELAGAPEVRDQASLRDFYGHSGLGYGGDDHVESAAAQETWIRVLYELRDAR